jgi:hypothetical protein
MVCTTAGAMLYPSEKFMGKMAPIKDLTALKLDLDLALLILPMVRFSVPPACGALSQD